VTFTETHKAIARYLWIAALPVACGIALYQVFIQPGQMRERVTEAENVGTVADTRNNASKDAQKITESHYVERRIIEEKTNSGVEAVLSGADDASVSRSARTAACLFNHSYPADHPTCKVQ
jgi:hypothetical protein